MAESFLRFDPDTPEHPKISRLMTRYGERGFLSLLRVWILAAKFYRAGRFDGLSAKELAASARAPGKPPEEFIDTLVTLKLLDLDGETFSVHNWTQRQPFIATAEQRSERNTHAAIARWARHNRNSAPADSVEIEPEPDSDPAQAEGSSATSTNGNGNGNGNGKAPEKLTAQDLADGWNEHCVAAGFARVEILSTDRKQRAARRLSEQPNKEFWARVFGNLTTSPFLRGLKPARKPDEKPFKADFDWLVLNSNNCVKVFEGKYNGQ